MQDTVTEGEAFRYRYACGGRRTELSPQDGWGWTRGCVATGGAEGASRWQIARGSWCAANWELGISHAALYWSPMRRTAPVLQVGNIHSRHPPSSRLPQRGACASHTALEFPACLLCSMRRGAKTLTHGPTRSSRRSRRSCPTGPAHTGMQTYGRSGSSSNVPQASVRCAPQKAMCTCLHATVQVPITCSRWLAYRNVHPRGYHVVG